MDVHQSASFGDLLRNFRKEAGLTQEELAEKAGVSARAVSDLERDSKRRSHRDTLKRLMKALQLSVEDQSAMETVWRQSMKLASPPPTPSASSANVAPATRAVVHGAPVQVTSLVGREEVVTSIGMLLQRADVRLLTLYGPGGVGKTRVAGRIADELHRVFADGVYWVSLASIHDPELVAPTIGQILDVESASGNDPQGTLLSALDDRHLLLILDNFEQVLDAATLLVKMIGTCPRVRLLVTSRALLHVSGEHGYVLHPLQIPDPRVPLAVEHLVQVESIRLFVERAQATNSEFRLTPENASVIAAICRRVDGLPLALELAAARVNLLPLPTLLDRLERRLSLLTGGARDLPQRQQTLRATLAWSYELLRGGEQSLLRRLAVFAGGWTLQACEAICTGSDQGRTIDIAIDTVLDSLGSLLDNSLIRQETQEGSTVRFGMLETVREYAAERLHDSGEADAMHHQHATYFLALAEAAEPELRGEHQREWLALLEQEHDNLRTALRWVSDEGEWEMGLRLAGALWRFWYLRGHLTEGQQWLATFLGATDQSGDISKGTRAKALHGAGALAHYQGAYAQATTLYERSLTLRRELGDQLGSALTLNNLGAIAQHQGRYAQARTLHEESLAIRTEVGDQWAIAQSLGNLGSVAAYQGDYTQATTFFEQALTIQRDLGDRQASALTLNNLGDLAHRQGDYARAGIWMAEALHLFYELGDQVSMATCLEGLADVSLHQGHAERAARQAGAAARLRQVFSLAVPPSELLTYEHILAAIRSTLDTESFANAWQAGQVLNLSQIIDETLAANAT